MGLSGCDPGLGETDNVADGLEPSRDVVGNLDVEPFLARHHDLDTVETVGAEILGQAGPIRQRRLLDAEVEDDDVPDLGRDVAHHTHP